MIFSFCEKTKHPHMFCVDFHIIVGGFTDPSDPPVLVVYRLHLSPYFRRSRRFYGSRLR